MLESSVYLKEAFDKKEIRNILLYSIGNLISMFGTSIYNFCIALYVLKLTGSGLSFSITLILGVISAVIVNPFAGVLADKFNKKTIVVIMDLLNGVLLITLYFLSSMNGLNILMIYVSTFILNIFTTIYNISFESAKPNLVSDKSLMKINSIGKIIDSISSILGPMLGWVVFAFMDIRFFIAINGVSFIMSGILEIFIDFKLNYEEKNLEEIAFIEGIKAGFKYIRERKNVIKLVEIMIYLNFFIGLSINVPMPFIINNVLKLSTKSFGIIEGAFPVGMILGALFVNKVNEKYPYDKLLKFMIRVLAICILMIGIPILFSYIKLNDTTYLIYYAIVMGVMGVTIAFIDIPLFYIFQNIIPDEYRGRVLSLTLTMTKVTLPLALIISGSLINLIPSYTLSLVGGVLLLIISYFYK
ncbi:MFS transporter [Clostridium amazonitimonense]|uniref:MFS transporter n=1 Tax=Clostridium amazonitimonense TaxID=1499689 RepID=UPI00050971F1|nr:MFS transporter [Clostridium amazonitimonense]